MDENKFSTPARDLPNLVRMTDKEKAAVAPEMARRAAILFGLVRFSMIRRPVTDEEQKVWDALLEAFPTYSEKRNAN
jgi:hypothetical protein